MQFNLFITLAKEANKSYNRENINEFKFWKLYKNGIQREKKGRSMYILPLLAQLVDYTRCVVEVIVSHL